MKNFTGNRDTDYKILQLLEDSELGKICSTSKYIKKLCEGENFWRNRTFNKFGQYLGNLDRLKQYKEDNHFDTWRGFYIALVDTMEKIKNNNFSRLAADSDYQMTLAFKQDIYDIPEDIYFKNNFMDAYDVIKDEKALDKFMGWQGPFIVYHMLDNPNQYIFDKMTEDWSIGDLFMVLEQER